MQWKKIREKYPEMWDEIYENMIVDLKEYMSRHDVSLYEKKYKYNKLDRIAHNAAFLGCLEHHYRIKK